MNSTCFTISPTLFSGLAGLISGEKSPLSPLNIPNPPALTPDQQAGLVQAGILGDSGPTDPARALLQSLFRVSSYARLRLSAPGGFLDEAVHFPLDGAGPLAISLGPNGLTLSGSADAETILARLAEFTGGYARPPVAWAVELPAVEMLALAALLDLRRRAVLRSLADQQRVVPPPGDPLAVAGAIQAMWANPQWLTAAVQTYTGLTVAPSAPQIQVALGALVEKKLAWQQSGMFLPAPETIQVIDRFLLIGSILTLDAANSNSQGRCVYARRTWLQAGVSEMLSLSASGDGLRLEVVAPAAALDQIRFFLITPDAIPAPLVDVPSLSLIIQVGVGIGQTYPLGDETVLGRGEQATIRILDTRASRRHTLVQKLPDGYQISDAGSTNGTYLNGQFLSGPARLREGDVIAIGETHLKVIRTSGVAQVTTGDRTIMADGPSQPLVKSTPPAPEPVSPPPPPAAVPESLLPEPLAPAGACPRCHEPVQPGDRVCGNCGLPLDTPPAPPAPPPTPATCPQCGAALTPGARFCGGCGGKVG